MGSAVRKKVRIVHVLPRKRSFCLLMSVALD